MSWSGLNTGLYEQIRRHAELTDQALLELKDDSDHPKQEGRERLAKLLSDIDSKRKEDLSVRLIWLILNETLNMKKQEIKSLSEALLDNVRKESTVKSLEKLAQALAKEQSIVKNRKRSGMR